MTPTAMSALQAPEQKEWTYKDGQRGNDRDGQVRLNAVEYY